MAASAGSQYQTTVPKLLIGPNTPVQIRLNLMASQPRVLQGEFIGVQHYDFFVVRVPSVPGIRNLLVPHTLVEVRYSIAGAVHSFHAEVVSHVIKPALLLFLTYPDRISIMEMRKTQRCSCALPVFISCTRGDCNGIIADISMGGCQVCFPLSGNAGLREIEKDENIALQTFFSAAGTLMSATGTIRKIDGSAGVMLLGVSFDDMPPDFVAQLATYCSAVKELLG